MGILILALTLAGSWLLTGRLAIFVTSNHPRLFQGSTFWLLQGAEVGQAFVSSYPGLSGVSVLLVGREESGDNSTVLIFRLKESCASKDDLRRVRAIVPHAENLNGTIFYPFTFTPIDESTNRTFCFLLESISEQEQETIVGVRTSRVDVYPSGQAYYQLPPEKAKIAPVMDETTGSKLAWQVFLPIIDKESSKPHNVFESDVGFQLHYNGRPHETFQVFMTHFVDLKPYFFGSTGFYIILLVLYFIGLFLLIHTVLIRSK